MQYIEDFSLQGRKEEIDGKLIKLRVLMEKNDWDAVLINKSENFAWVTAGGNNIVTRYVEGGICTIMITRDDQYYICNNIETLRMEEEENLSGLGFKPLTMMWYENQTIELIRSVIGDRKYASDSGLNGSEDASSEIIELEKVLCNNEIGRYLHLGKVFSDVIESYMGTIEVGDTEEEIAGRLSARMWENGLEPVLFLVASDERINKYRHPVPTKKPVNKILAVSCNARYKGLITKITRMMHFGKVPRALLNQYRKTIEIENQLVAMTRPGVDDRQIFQKAKQLYKEAGYPDMWREHHQGGPQSYTNGFYLMNDDNHEVVRLNQCYGYNPTITGTKSEDGFIVARDEPIFLTYPVAFPTLESMIGGIRYIRPGILEKN